MAVTLSERDCPECILDVMRRKVVVVVEPVVAWLLLLLLWPHSLLLLWSSKLLHRRWRCSVVRRLEPITRTLAIVERETSATGTGGTIHHRLKQITNVEKRGTKCGTVGRVVATDTRESRFESKFDRALIYCIKKTIIEIERIRDQTI